MIFTQQRNHLKAIVNSESVLKIQRPHSHVDSKRKVKKPKTLQKYDYYREIAKTFNKIHNMKKSDLDTGAPKSYYMNHVKGNNENKKGDHNLNLKSMVKHLDEIETRKSNIRPATANASTKFSMRRPFDMLPSTMYSGAYLEKSAKFKKIKSPSSNYINPNKIEALMPSEELLQDEYMKKFLARKNEEELVSGENHRAFLNEIKEDMVYDSAASTFMILKRKIYEYIIENKILGEKQLNQLERATLQIYPEVGQKMISDFFFEIKAFLKRPL